MACDLKFVKAPNGKKSKMFDALNEEFGQNQALKTWVATKTPVFEKEFGKSKIVDSNGEPLLMYRGEKQGIEKFTYKGHRTPSKLGRGIYFTSNKDYAKGFGTVYPVFINSENVKVYENKLAFLKDVADHYDIETVPNRNQQLSYVDNLHSKGIDVAFEGFTELNIHSDTQYKIAVDMNSEKDIMHPIRKEAAEERLLDLEKRLISFLSPFGITVEAYASLKEKTGYDAAGMANITKKLILISQDKAKVDTLPEEVGHFIYELLGEENPLVKRMRDLAVKTDLYAEVKEDPENIKAYGTDESRYIAETVGKLIGRALVSNFQTDAQPKTMLNTIKRIWERIKKFFQKADLKKLQREVEEVYGSLASNILQGDATGLSVENMRDGFYLQTDDSAKQPTELTQVEKTANIIEAQLKSGTDLKAILNTLTKNGHITKNNNSSIVNDSGRDIVLFNIDGVIVPMYRSSKGTGDKTAGKWYPFFFSTDEWIVKGIGDNYENGYGNKIIKQLLDALNENHQYESPIAKTKLNSVELVNTLKIPRETLKDNFGIYDMRNYYSAIRMLQNWHEDLGGLTVENGEQRLTDILNSLISENKSNVDIVKSLKEAWTPLIEAVRELNRTPYEQPVERKVPPVSEEITAEQVHKAAEEAGMVWDSEEEGSKEFMDLSEKITGVRHIEKMGNEQRSKLIDAIKKTKPSTISEEDKVVDETLTNIEDNIIDAKNSIQARIDQLIKTADEGDVKAKNIRKNLEYLLTLLDSEDKKFALINFLKKAQKDMFIVRKKFREMKESGEVSARDMLRYSRYVEAYNKKFINGILKEIEGSEEFALLIPKEKQEAFRNSFGRLRDDIEADFFELGKPLLAKVLSKLNANTDISEGDILAELSKSTKDIATWQRWIETLAESPDTIIALAAKMVNEQKEAARLATIEFNHELLDKIDEFEKFRGREASKDPKALYEIFYARDEDGKLIGRLLKYDEALEKLGKDSKEFEFYEYFTQTYYKLQKLLPWQFNKGLWLASLRETAQEKVASGKSLFAATHEVLSDLLTWQVDDVGFGSESGIGAKSAHKFVPVLYHTPIGTKPGQLSPDLVSYDFGNSLQAFGAMAINNSHMNTIVSELEVLKEILAVRRITKTSGKDPVPDKSKKHGTAEQRALTDLGASSNVYAQFSMYLDQVMYGERKSSDEIELPWGGKIPKTKLADALNKYSSLRALGFNLFSGISNLTMGKTMNFVEAHAGQWFTKKDFLWAQKEYLIGMSGFLSDLRKKRNKSFYGQIVEKFDGLQEYDEYGNRVTGNRLWKRLISISSIFFLQKGGEHEIQVSLLIAFLKGQKIKTKSGEEISLIDAFEQKNGELVVKDNVEYTKEQLIKDSQKFKQISQKLHGIYNQQDLINMQHVWAGRLGILFRKWLYPSFKRRYGGTRFNQRLESYEEGNYITAKNFFRDVYRNMKALDVTLIGSYHATKGAMPEWQKQNMRRTKMELMITLSLIALIAFISGLDDEDEERNWIENMTLFQLHRLYGEMSMYWNPKEALKILKSPAASMSAVENVFRLISGIAGVAGGLIFEGEVPKYERDSGLYEEGDWKILKPFEELWPLWKEIRAVQAPENRLKWMEWK